MSKSDLLGTKMLLATDGSGVAELATRAAVELAEGTGSDLHLVYVESLPDFMKNGAGTPGLRPPAVQDDRGRGPGDAP
jgi:nucleotide-binding universal stress UspA family protein